MAVRVFHLLGVWTLILFRDVSSFVPSPRRAAALSSPSQQRLYTSLSTPPQDVQNTIDDDDGDEQRRQDTQRFRQYLRTLPYTSKDPAVVAQRMDAELQQMSARFFDQRVNDDDGDGGKDSYQGPAVAPDIPCYTMVLSAYARANLGREGAHLAEAAYQRCLEETGGDTNVILKTNCLRAWAKADDWQKVDEWLQDMEETYQKTGLDLDAPDTITYTCYLEQLASTKSLSRKEIGERTMATLEKIRKWTETGENPFCGLSSMLYHGAMRCFAAAEHNLAALDASEALFREMQEIYRRTGNVDFKPSAATMRQLFQVAAHCHGGIVAARRANTWWKELQLAYRKTMDADYIADEQVYTALLTTYAHVEPEHAHEIAEEVDELLKALDLLNSGPQGPKHQVHVYTAAINAKASARTLKSVQEAETILRAIPHPDTVAYQCVIRAYARIEQAEAADNLLWELQHLVDDAQSTRSILQGPDILTISMVVTAWSKTRNTGSFSTATDRALKLGQLIIDTYRSGKVKKDQRNIDEWTLDAIAQMLSVSHRKDAGRLAEELIMARNALNEASGSFAPSHHTYVLAIDAWANSGVSNAGSQAMRLMTEIERLHKKGELEEGSNIRVLSSVLLAVTKSSWTGQAMLVAQLFQRIIDNHNKGDRSATINTRLLTCAFSYMMKSHGPPGKVRALLQQIVKSSSKEECDFPTTAVFNSVLTGLAKRGKSVEAEEMIQQMKVFAVEGKPCAPDVSSLAALMRAHANDPSRKGSGPIAERYLREAETLFKNGDTSMEPDTRMYNAVLTAYAKDSSTDSQAISHVERLFDEMDWAAATGERRTSPDLVSFGSLCQAYARSRVASGPFNVKNAFDKVQMLVGERKLKKLDMSFYTAVISSLAKSKVRGALPVAESIFLHMDKSKTVFPDQWMYNTLLRGWSKSNEPDRLARCLSLFERMEHAPGIEIDIESHNSVIHAAARSPSVTAEEKLEDFGDALKHFRALHKSETLHPTCLSYSFFLNACRKLLVDCDDRRNLVKKAFGLCRQKALVSVEVLGEMYRCMPEFLKEELAKEGVEFDLVDAKIDHIPESWCSNTVSRKRTQDINLKRWH